MLGDNHRSNARLAWRYMFDNTINYPVSVGQKQKEMKSLNRGSAFGIERQFFFDDRVFLNIKKEIEMDKVNAQLK